MKNSKIKFILLLGVVLNILLINLVKAQTERDISGRNLVQRSVTNFSGSTFLTEEWSKGVIKFTDNTSSNSVDIKYDQLDDLVLFKNDKGETLIVSDPIKEFKILLIKDGNTQEILYRSGFNPVNNNSAKSFYEVIADNTIKFVKRTIKTIVEEKEYNAASTTKKVIDKSYYFIVKSNTPILVSKSEKPILNAIGDKIPELTAYIKENKLNLKNDSDISKLLKYYDQLTK